jgi:hypothetical protein
VDQLWVVLGPLIAIFGGLIVRAHLLDIVVALIQGWTSLISLSEHADVRAELRSTIRTHVAEQLGHYLNDRKLGPAEAAIRLFEWQVASMPADICAAFRAVLERVGAIQERLLKEAVAHEMIRRRGEQTIRLHLDHLLQPEWGVATSEDDVVAWKEAYDKALRGRTWFARAVTIWIERSRAEHSDRPH